MGINISLYRVLSIEKEEGWGGKYYDFCKTECIEWFDHLRYSGDRDFISNNKFKSIDSDDEYIRPVNIEQCRKWIKENVYEGNQERLLKAIDLIEEDEMVGFHVSY